MLFRFGIVSFSNRKKYRNNTANEIKPLQHNPAFRRASIEKFEQNSFFQPIFGTYRQNLLPQLHFGLNSHREGLPNVLCYLVISCNCYKIYIGNLTKIPDADAD